VGNGEGCVHMIFFGDGMMELERMWIAYRDNVDGRVTCTFFLAC